MRKFRWFHSVKKESERGFTLIELVLYVGILSILVGVLGTMFGSILDVQMEAEATASVDQDGRYILAKLSRDMKTIDGGNGLNDTILTPLNAGDSSPTLQIRANSVTYTYSVNGSNNLQVSSSTGETNVLNSVGSSVSGLSFQRIGNGDKNDTIRVNFTVASRIPQAKGYEMKSFQTSLARQ